MEPASRVIMNRKDMEVRWGDCDAAGITYYAKYFDWFSDGRIELLRQAGLPYMTSFHKQGIFLVAVDASCSYKHTLEPEEKVVLETSLSKLTRSRLEFSYKIYKKNENVLAAYGATVHAYVDAQGKPFDVKKRHPLLWEKLSGLAGVAGAGYERSDFLTHEKRVRTKFLPFTRRAPGMDTHDGGGTF